MTTRRGEKDKCFAPKTLSADVHERQETTMFQKVWGVAEQMHWDRRFPRFFWRWLLRWCDRRAGYTPDGALGDILLKARADLSCEGQGPTQP